MSSEIFDNCNTDEFSFRHWALGLGRKFPDSR